LVTSDADVAYLSRKLRERGAAVCIVGESKTPDALRNASDQFFEWRSEGLNTDSFTPIEQQTKTGATQTDHQVPVVKRRPRFVVEAVSLLTGSTAEGKVTLSGLGSYLKRTDPGFSPAEYGHSGLLEMVKTYDLLEAQMELGGHWTLRLATETKS
uniref:OST-HTH/LOTUS domain-containing protein n=1 Tax=Pseudomonas viridiflava TaxID=33069 RepID=UPI000F092417